jgi:N-methylhydantoinase A
MMPHERRAREIVKRMAPDVFVLCSVDIAPKWGEYERTAATVLNAYIGPVMSRYLSNLDQELKRNHYRQPLQIAQCGGGSVSIERAMESPLLTLDSGPVAGVTGSLFFGRTIEVPPT